MLSGERRMTSVAMTTIKKEYWPSWGSNQRPPVPKSCLLLTESWDPADDDDDDDVGDDDNNY